MDDRRDSLTESVIIADRKDDVREWLTREAYGAKGARTGSRGIVKASKLAWVSLDGEDIIHLATMEAMAADKDSGHIFTRHSGDSMITVLWDAAFEDAHEKTYTLQPF